MNVWPVDDLCKAWFFRYFMLIQDVQETGDIFDSDRHKYQRFVFVELHLSVYLQVSNRDSQVAVVENQILEIIENALQDEELLLVADVTDAALVQE